MRDAVWEGDAADAAIHRTDTDLVTARGNADKSREVAAIARNGDETVRAAQQRVLSTVAEARDAGFEVRSDLRSLHARRR